MASNSAIERCVTGVRSWMSDSERLLLTSSHLRLAKTSGDGSKECGNRILAFAHWHQQRLAKSRGQSKTSSRTKSGFGSLRRGSHSIPVVANRASCAADTLQSRKRITLYRSRASLILVSLSPIKSTSGSALLTTPSSTSGSTKCFPISVRGRFTRNLKRVRACASQHCWSAPTAAHSQPIGL